MRQKCHQDGCPDEQCIVVRNAIKAASPSVACLQETKLNEISCFKAKTFLPLTWQQTGSLLLLMVPEVAF
jgi:hypothetical protein